MKVDKQKTHCVFHSSSLIDEPIVKLTDDIIMEHVLIATSCGRRNLITNPSSSHLKQYGRNLWRFSRHLIKSLTLFYRTYINQKRLLMHARARVRVCVCVYSFLSLYWHPNIYLLSVHSNERLSSRLVISFLFNTPPRRPEIDYIVWTIRFTFVNRYERLNEMSSSC